MLEVAPVFACFAATEWMVVTGSGSFAGLIGFIGVIVGSLLAGIFPVLLLVVASAASVGPARRAARVDPVDAMRG